MRWLCRLVTPPGGTILDPFAGSGTTGQAARDEGFDCILVEREPEYQADIERRLGLNGVRKYDPAIDDAKPIKDAQKAPPAASEDDLVIDVAGDDRASL